MIKSKYILDILNLLLDGDNEGLSARNQIPFLSEDNFEHTGSGLFVGFSHSENIFKHKIAKSDLVLNGVKITTAEFPIEADATLFFRNGLIDNLEIWCSFGEYPQQELTKYTLKQVWENSPNKIISTEN
jgi:hypothetical protein